MRRHSKTLPKPTSNVIDRSFRFRHQRKLEALDREKRDQQVEREVQLMMEADQREYALLSVFKNLPIEKQNDILAIAKLYHEHYGIESSSET